MPTPKPKKKPKRVRAVARKTPVEEWLALPAWVRTHVDRMMRIDERNFRAASRFPPHIVHPEDAKARGQQADGMATARALLRHLSKGSSRHGR